MRVNVVSSTCSTTKADGQSLHNPFFLGELAHERVLLCSICLIVPPLKDFVTILDGPGGKRSRKGLGAVGYLLIPCCCVGGKNLDEMG